MKGNKAQAIAGLLFSFVLIAVFAIILAPLFAFIDIGINASISANVTNADLIVTILNSLPVFMALVALVAVVALITGRQQ